MRLIVGDPAKLTSAPCQRVNRVNPEFEICSWRYSGARLDRMGWVPAKDPPLVDAFRLLVCDPFAKFGDTPCWKATVRTHVMALHQPVPEQFIQFGVGALARAHEPSVRIDRERSQNVALLNGHRFGEFELVLCWSCHFTFSHRKGPTSEASVRRLGDRAVGQS